MRTRAESAALPTPACESPRRYGKEFSQEVVANKDKYLNHRLNRMLSSTVVPDPTVVVAYLTEIAKT